MRCPAVPRHSLNSDVEFRVFFKGTDGCGVVEFRFFRGRTDGNVSRTRVRP